MPGVLLFLVAAGAALAGEPSPARLLNLPELVTADDYPRVALVNEQQGTVTVRLKIDKDGLVTSCAIAKSSGHAALDEQSCALYRARARFEPARNARGDPIATTYNQRVTWKLAETQEATLMPRQAWMVRSIVGLSRQGKVVDCKIESIGVAAPTNDCAIVTALLQAQLGEAPETDRAEAFTITETYFYPVEASKAARPPDLKDATKMGQQVSQIVIDSHGLVTKCEGLDYSGIAAPERDACQFLKHGRFVAAGEAAKDLTGTVVMTVYRRTLSVT